MQTFCCLEPLFRQTTQLASAVGVGVCECVRRLAGMVRVKEVCVGLQAFKYQFMKISKPGNSKHRRLD